MSAIKFERLTAPIGVLQFTRVFDFGKRDPVEFSQPVDRSDGGDIYIYNKGLSENTIVLPFQNLPESDYKNNNFLLNWLFNDWANGASSAPDDWTLSGAGASIAQEATIIKKGTYSAKLTRGGADCYLSNNARGSVSVIPLRDQNVTFGKWVYATVANRARLRISDGISADVSSYHTGGSSWEFLTVTRTIDSAATKVEPQCHVLTGDTSAYFSGGIVEKVSTVTTPDGNLKAFAEEIVEGAANSFTYTDENGIEHTCRLLTPKIDFADTRNGTRQGNLILRVE
jgi:hypothetical protein